MQDLILFDIDGTLLRTEGVGIAAMLRAFAALHGDRGFSFDGVEIAGALDSLLFGRMMATHGLPADDDAHRRFQSVYRDELARGLANARTRAMPGAGALADDLHLRGCAVGLLTGNYRETAHLKLVAAGYAPERFPFGAFGADGSSRRALTPVALARAQDHHGRAFAPERTTVIGDTPHDVDCAKAHGCRAIGVATGPYSVGQLEAAGADLAVADLSDVPGIARWIVRDGVSGA